MSTVAPSIGEQDAPDTATTFSVSFRGVPSFTSPVCESARMSERRSLSSRKYGPSVSSGRTMHVGRLALVATAVLLTSAAALTAVDVDAAVASGTEVAVFAAVLAPCVGVAVAGSLSSPPVQATRSAAAPPSPSMLRISRRLSSRPLRMSSSSMSFLHLPLRGRFQGRESVECPRPSVGVSSRTTGAVGESAAYDR